MKQNIKYIPIVVGALGAVVIFSTVFYFFQQLRVVTAPQGQKSRLQSKKPSNKIQSFKKLVFVPAQNFKVSGDGTFVIRNNTAFVTVELSNVKPAKGEQYDVYILPASNAEPVFLGTMLPALPGGKEQLVWGGSGPDIWYSANKLVIFKRSSLQAKPGTIVAEANIPSEGFDQK